MKDYFGEEIKEGDFLFYAIRSGNLASVKVGKVKEVKEKYVSIVTAQMISKKEGDEYIYVPSTKTSKGCFYSTHNAMIIPASKALSYAPVLKEA